MYSMQALMMAMARQRIAPATDREVTRSGHFCEPMNLIKHRAATPLDFTPQPAPIFENYGRAISIFADHKRIAERGRSSDVDVLASIRFPVHDCNHGRNSFLESHRDTDR